MNTDLNAQESNINLHNNRYIEPSSDDLVSVDDDTSIIGDAESIHLLEDESTKTTQLGQDHLKNQQMAEGRIRLINKPKISKLDKARKIQENYGSPAAGITGGLLGLADPTGISTVAVNTLNDSTTVILAYQDRSAHKKWVSEIAPLAAPSAHIDNLVIANSLMRDVSTILDKENDLELIKEKFDDLGMNISKITSKEQLQRKLKEPKFLNQLINDYRRLQESRANAKEIFERGKQQFEAIVQEQEGKGLTHEEAIAEAHKQIDGKETHRVTTEGINLTLAGTVKKIQKVQRSLINLRFGAAISQVSATLLSGLASIGVKVASVAGVVTIPIAIAVTLPLSLIPLGVRMINGGIRLAVFKRLRPATAHEKVHGTGLLISYEKLSLMKQKSNYRSAVNKMNEQWAKKDKIENQLQDGTLSSKKRHSLEKRLINTESKIITLKAQAMKLIEKTNATKNKILDLKQRMIDAGWRDAQMHLKLPEVAEGEDYAVSLGNWLFEEYQAKTLNSATNNFLLKQMAIDVEEICRRFPGQEAEAITYHIKEFYAKDEEKMLDMIRSQRRKFTQHNQ